MHIAMIPARQGSEGFKFKNRMFFDNTADFIEKIAWFERRIVSSDDLQIKNFTQKRGFEFHNRSSELAGPAVSIKAVFKNLIQDMNIKGNDILWLFYLPILYKNQNDFILAKDLVEEKNIKSLCSFVPAKTHPYNCWRFNRENRCLSQYIKNDKFRRQDLPEAWMHYHYICCFKAEMIDVLNSELIYAETYPYFLSKELRDMLIEVDTPADYERWKEVNKKLEV